MHCATNLESKHQLLEGYEIGETDEQVPDVTGHFVLAIPAMKLH